MLSCYADYRDIIEERKLVQVFCIDLSSVKEIISAYANGVTLAEAAYSLHIGLLPADAYVVRVGHHDFRPNHLSQGNVAPVSKEQAVVPRFDFSD